MSESQNPNPSKEQDTAQSLSSNESHSEEVLQLPETVKVIEDGERTIYVIGTAHVSNQSVQDVEETIEKVQPDSVVIELCENRLEALKDEDRWTKLDVFKVVKEGKGTMMLATLLLSSQQNQLAEKFNSKPGGEFIRAKEICDEKNIPIVLGDRDVQITLKRTWAQLGWWSKVRIMYMGLNSILFSVEITEEEMEKLKTDDALSKLMKEFAEAFPAVMHPLIVERDLYLMDSIQDAPGKKVVAVVGAGHVPGIVKHWGEKVDRNELATLPESKSWFKHLKWLIPIAVIAALIFGFNSSKEQGIEMVKYWFIFNFAFACIGALAAFAHPLSILAAGLVSPFSSMNPLIQAGWVSGIIEAWLRKPKVEDLSNLQRDTQSLRGWYKNRAIRVLLVAALSNVGSVIGMMVSGYFIADTIAT